MGSNYLKSKINSKYCQHLYPKKKKLSLINITFPFVLPVYYLLNLHDYLSTTVDSVAVQTDSVGCQT